MAQPGNSSPVKELETYFQEAAKGKGYYISKDNLNQISERQFKKIALPYLTADQKNLRGEAIQVIKRKALLLPDPESRSPYISWLIEACMDEDSGNSGRASKALTNFKVGDFSADGRMELLNVLKSKPYHYKRIIKLSGFAPSAETILYLKETLLSDSALNYTEQWTVHLALARNQDTASMQYILDRVKTVTLNDGVVTHLYGDLAYTRQTEAYRFMLQAILSDEANCSSGNPYYDKKMVCAYQIIELIGPSIFDFPLSLNKWGELEFDDYDQDLQTVREWVRSEPMLELKKEFF